VSGLIQIKASQGAALCWRGLDQRQEARMRRMDVVVVGADRRAVLRARAGRQRPAGRAGGRAAAPGAGRGRLRWREIALTHASRQSMEQLGLWQRLPQAEVAELRDARVMNGGSPFALTFASSQVDGQPLGWLVPNHLIRRAAWDAVQGQDGWSCSTAQGAGRAGRCAGPRGHR
jgi:hypothetical protein